MPACKLASIALALLSAAALASPARAAAGFQYWNVKDTSKAPRTLSATGLYTSIAGKQKTLLPNAWHFDVNSALWSDDSKKSRWVLLKPGASIGFRVNDDYWDYPDSTVFIKQFAVDTIPGDTNTRVLWETRLLINAKEIEDSAAGTRADRWYGFTYKWDANQEDARLVKSNNSGMPDSIRIWPKGLSKPSRMKKWVFPSQDQCNRCHRSETGTEDLHARSVLGFFTAQLNRPHPDSTQANQLEYFFAKGVLTGAKPANWASAPRWRSIDDNTASLDVRARSYIAANCSGCHGVRGNGVSAAQHCFLVLDYHAMAPAMEVRHYYTSAFGLDDTTITPRYFPKTDLGNNPLGRDSVEIQPALVVPGYPQKSVLLFRQLSRDTIPGDYDGLRNQMPPMATFEVNTAATDLIAEWIRTMPPLAAPYAAIAARHGRTIPEIAFRAGRLVLSPEAARSRARVSMAAVNGREIPLQRISEGVYAMPEGLPKGLYFIRVGARSLLQYLM